MLSNIKLSLLQYAYGMAALVFGGLILALRLQGTRLHKAQVDLLQAKYIAVDQQAQSRTKQAIKAFDEAMRAYHRSL